MSSVDPPPPGALGRASDAQLTSLIRQGSHDAFAALYARHAALVDAVARASSGERAEDIAQETWTSAYRALSAPGKPIDHVAPWLTTIARNAARDRHRRDMLRPELVNDDVVAGAAAAGGVESALEGKHTIGRLLGAFDELPEEQRVILHLREFGGLTYRQIAEQLGKPESTIEAALFRARRKMAKEYAELDSGRRCSVVQSQLVAGSRLSRMERRRLTRHLGRCVSCERVARLEGAQDLIPAPRLARIAGAIPMPAVAARVLASAADAARPFLGKAAVAAVAVAAGAGGLVLSQHGGSAPTTAGTGSGTAAPAAAGTSQVVLRAAPHVVRAHRVTAVAERTDAGGSAPAARPRPTTRAGTAGPVAAPPTTAAPPRSHRVENVQHTTAPARPVQPATGAPQPAPAVAVAPAAAPAPTQPVQQAAAPVTQPSAQPVNQPAPTGSSRPAAPAGSGGPSVTQTATCLVAACRVGG